MAIQHCLVCGTTHDSEKSCPIYAFVLHSCSCGNEGLIPADVLAFGGLNGMFCGQCNKDTEWTIKRPTIEDMKKHWTGYVAN